MVGGGGSTAPVACRMHRRQHARRVAEAQRCRCALRASRGIMPGEGPLSQPAPQLAGQCCVPCRHVAREARTFDGRPTEPDTRCRVLLAATGHGSVSTASTAGHQLAADGARHASTATSATRLIVGTLDHRPGAASSHTADHACTSSVVNRLSFAADAAARRECWPGARVQGRTAGHVVGNDGEKEAVNTHREGVARAPRKASTPQPSFTDGERANMVVLSVTWGPLRRTAELD